MSHMLLGKREGQTVLVSPAEHTGLLGLAPASPEDHEDVELGLLVADLTSTLGTLVSAGGKP